MKKIVSILAASSVAASLLSGVVPMTVMADGTMVVSIGADLTEDQKTAILKYFGVYGNNSVQMITVTNQDERNHLASYIPIEQIGSRTISCALVKPTVSGGVQVKTANLDYITSNMIASNLITCGVTNCQAIAAAPFEVSGTGALTGILMAYENATGQEITQADKNLSAQEIELTEDLTGKTENQQVAQQIVNDVKLQVIDGTLDDSDSGIDSVGVIDNSTNVGEVNNTAVSNIVTNVVNNYTENNVGISLTEDDIQKLTDYAVQLAQQSYEKGAEEAKAQIQAQAQVQQNLTDLTGIQNTDASAQIVENSAAENGQDDTGAAEAETEATEEDIFANTDIGALDDGSGISTLVTGTDQGIINNDTSEGATDNDAVISSQTDETASSEAGADDSGIQIITLETNSNTGETDPGEVSVVPTTEVPAAEVPAAEVPVTEVPAAEEPAAALTITTDQTDSYSTYYLADADTATVPAFVLALRCDDLVPVSGTLTVSDESGNVLGTADLSDSSLVTAVTSAAVNDEFRLNNGWDQLTGLFIQSRDGNGNIVAPQAGTNYVLTLSGTFAQSADPAATDGAPLIAVDLENITYAARAPFAAGLDFNNVALNILKAGSTFTSYVPDDGTFSAATVISPDGSAIISTADGTGTVYSGIDTSVSVTLNAAGLAEINIAYSQLGTEATEADGTSSVTDMGTLRYFIPVQAQ